MQALYQTPMKNLQRLLITVTLLAGVFTIAHPAAAALKTWNGLAGDMLWSSAGNWSPAGPPGASDNVTFTNDAVADNPIVLGGAVNNIVDANFLNSINSLSYMNTNGFHNTSLINPLIVRGTSATDVAFISDDGEPAIFSVGSGTWADGKDAIVYTSIIGNSLTVSNGNANLNVMQTSVTAGAHRATLDLTDLNSFTCVVSKVLVGHDFAIVDHAYRPTGTLILARTNSITSGVISVADVYQNTGPMCYIHLGQANTLNADKVRIGVHKCSGTVDFNPGLVSPSLTLRNPAGTGRQIFWEIGDMFEPNTTTIGFFSSGNANGTLDLTGARVDALVDRITLGRGQIQVSSVNRLGDGIGTITFGGGSIDANYLEMGIQIAGPFIGGSVGRATLNVNNDPGIGPALFTLHSNLVMAVQQPGNLDAIGSTAVININGGTVAVAGDIIDGAGLSTITLDTGGTLNLKPAGDATPGNVSVDILNIPDGIFTNFATLSVSNINLPGPVTQFTVYPGQALAPIAVGVIGTLSVAGDLTLRGGMLMDIRKFNSTLTSDVLAVTGTLDLGGTLTVTFSGNNNLVVGDRFTLFTAGAFANAFTTLKLPPPGSGLAWLNKILIDGSIEVVASGEPMTPPTIAMTSSPTSLSLSWPTAYTSFALRGQTNSVTVGLSTNWGVVPGVVGNQITIPKNPANGAVFFQLFQQ